MDWSVLLPQVGVGSGWAVVVLGVVMLMRGQIVPRKTHEDALHDRDQWRTESRIKDQTIADLTEQNADMLNAFGPTLTDFLEGLRRAGINDDGGRP